MNIDIRLSPESLSEALKKLKAYQKWVDQKTKELVDQLAMIGVKEASVRFTTAMYDGDNDVKVSLHPYSNMDKSSGWIIEAKGKAVAFIEYGTGVYHNPGEPYPKPRPPGIVGIGEYGKGYGKRQGWKYPSGSEMVFTRGNPAAMPMWYATQEMERQLYRIVKEVFS